MKIAHFLASLLPSFGKEQVVEDIRLTRGELTEITEPAYKSAAEVFKSWRFKSKHLDDDFAQFKRMVKSGSDNMVVAIDKSLKTVVENLDTVDELINQTYNEEVAGAGLTYLKANLLQFVECVAFVSKFARKYLIYIYVCETAELDDQAGDNRMEKIAESISPAEIEWLKKNFLSFCTAWNVVTTGSSQLKKALNDIPDVVVTSDNVHTLGATMGENKIDPFQLKLIPVWLNPIYHIGMFVAEWQASRYKAAQEELKLLQLRKLNLQRLQQGKPDAKVQKEIEYMESRIQGLNFKLAKMEKQHG